MGKTTLYRSDLEELLANDETLGVSLATAHEVLERLFMEIIPQTISDGDRVVIPGFGTFHSTEVIERTIKHPQTQKDIVIPYRRYPRWSASTRVKMLCRADNRRDPTAA